MARCNGRSATGANGAVEMQRLRAMLWVVALACTGHSAWAGSAYDPLRLPTGEAPAPVDLTVHDTEPRAGHPVARLPAGFARRRAGGALQPRPGWLPRGQCVPRPALGRARLRRRLPAASWQRRLRVEGQAGRRAACATCAGPPTSENFKLRVEDVTGRPRPARALERRIRRTCCAAGSTSRMSACPATRSAR